MNYTTLAAPAGQAQPLCSTNAFAADRREQLEALPKQWRRGLLAIGRHKQPIDPTTGLPLKDWPNSAPPSVAHLVAAPAVGVRSGAITNTLMLDFDGPDAWQTFIDLFAGSAKEMLPPSIAWTSGKNMHCQIAYSVADAHHHLLESKKRKIGALEFRWNGQASVLMGHHPEKASGYHWLKGKSPFEVGLAQFPIGLLDLIPDASKRNVEQKRKEGFPGHGPDHYFSEITVPLIAFVTLRTAFLIENGSVEGNCNEDGIRLAMDLVAAERWVMAQKVNVDRSAQDLFDEYVANCPTRINGKPFNYRAMQARFDGAIDLQPLPPTPESKLFERLDFHKRQARNGRRAA